MQLLFTVVTSCIPVKRTFYLHRKNIISGGVGMQIMKFSFGTILILVFSTLTACGGGGSGSSDPANVSDTTAKSAAITKTVDRSIDAISGLADLATNSPFFQTLLQSRGIPIDQGFDPTAALSADIQAAAETLLSNGTRNGSTITYDPDEVAICSGASTLLAGLEDQVNQIDPGVISDCEDLYSRITVLQTITDNEQGTLDINYDAFKMITIGYGPDSTYAEYDLSQWASIIEGFGQGAGLPNTLQGTIRSTLTGQGPDHVGMTLSIEQDIKVVDDSENIDINIASTPKLFELTADAPVNSASLELALAQLDLMLPLTDGLGTDRQTEVHFDGLTSLAELGDNGEGLNLSNVGIGNLPLVIDVVDDSPGIDPIDFNLELATFAFNINGAGTLVTFDQMFAMALDIDDPFEIFSDTPNSQSTLAIDIDEGTELRFRTAGGFEVQENGSVSGNGTGDFVGTQEFLSGTCFSINLDGTFPLVPVDCS